MAADNAAATPRPPFAPPPVHRSIVYWSPALATCSKPTGQDPHSGPGAAQFNLGLPKCSLDNGQGHRHAHRSLDLSKPLLILFPTPLCGGNLGRGPQRRARGYMARLRARHITKTRPTVCQSSARRDQRCAGSGIHAP